MPTENGWEPWHAGADILEWIEIPGTNPPVHIQVQKGQPSAILKAFCADFNAYIEPLRDRDTACFTPTNSVATSNHLNGTAVDLNWDSHPFRVLNAGFDDAKLHRMRDLLAFYTLDGVQMVWWGNDWRNPKDAMHVNMGYNTYNNPATARFIAERIRPDGYSTYKREPVNAPKAPPAVSAVPQAGGEHVLKWDERITAQEQPWDCGPASAQVVLSTRGISKSEGELIRLCGTNTGGTDSIDQIRKALNGLGLNYETVWLHQDPPTPGQKEQFWADLQAAVNAGFGILMNWVSPASNPPVAIKGSRSPSRLYGRSTIYHYVTAMGYDADVRAVYVGDPGVGFNYWITLDNCASLMPPKGYLRVAGLNAKPAGHVPVADHGVDVLAEVMGNALPKDRYAALLPALEACLVGCGCTTVDRIAMWCAQIGHESGGLKWMQEIADGSAYEGRSDLGNTHPGDGKRFKGHGPIQITGRQNHTMVSEWAFSEGLVHDPTFFVDHPEELASDRYGFLGVQWYWSVARPNLNAAADAKDINKATRLINGGLHGIADRRNRYARAEAMGNRLLALIEKPQQPEGVRATSGYKSRSPYRSPEGINIGDIDQFILNEDGALHILLVEWSAIMAGDPDSIHRIIRSAAGRGADTSPEMVIRAKRVLAKVPRDYVTSALSEIEQKDPELLQELVGS